MLEALPRVAQLKALPTDAEMEEAGFTDAGAYLLWYAIEDEEGYQDMIDARATPWGDEPPQSAERMFDGLMSIIVRTIGLFLLVHRLPRRRRRRPNGRGCTRASPRRAAAATRSS